MTGIWRIITYNVKRFVVTAAFAYAISLLKKSKNKIMTKEKSKNNHSEEKEITRGLETEQIVNPILDHLLESTRVMELIKSQFGYSGYSNPNYVSLEKQIVANKLLIESLK